MKQNVKRLLELLGGDIEEPPMSLREAEMIHEIEEGEAHPIHIKHRERKENSCGKVCFLSQASAKSAMRSRLNKGCNKSRLRVYFCDHCKHWHITSSFYNQKK